MATYKDTLLLIDKVTEPLKKINDKMNSVTNTANKTDQSTHKLEQTFNNLVAPIKKAEAGLLKLDEKIGHMYSTLDKGKEKFKNFSKLGNDLGKFGAKITSAFAAATGAVIALGSAVLTGANRFAGLGDRIDKTSQQIGMSRKAFQEWDYIMSQNGGNVESLKMGYKTLANQMNGVKKGSKESIKAFQDLGISVADNTGKFKTQDQVFNEVIRALQNETDETKKAILGNQLFGRSFIEMKPLLNQSADAIDQLRQKANSMGLILSDEDINNAVEYKDTMDTFSRIFEAKFASIMMKIMPGLSEALTNLIGILDENQQVIDNIGASFQWIAGTALPAVVKAISFVINMFGNLGGIIGNIIGFIITIPTEIETAFNNAFNFILQIYNNFTQTWQSGWEGIKESALNVIAKIIAKVNELVEKLGFVTNLIPGLNSIKIGADVAKMTNKSINNKNTTNNTNNTTNNTYNTTTNNYGLGNRFNPLGSPGIVIAN